jgi:hypothetical protein
MSKQNVIDTGTAQLAAVRADYAELNTWVRDLKRDMAAKNTTVDEKIASARLAFIALSSRCDVWHGYYYAVMNAIVANLKGL